MTIIPMRAPGWLFLASSMIATTGCLDSVLGVMLAPEMVVSGLADTLVDSGTELINSAGEDLSSAAQTISELDSLIADNPDAQNVDRIKALRDQLKTNPLSDTNNPQAQQNLAKGPQARHAMNNSLIPRRAPDRITVLPPGEQSALPQGTKMDGLGSGIRSRTPSEKTYTLDMKPVRLR